MLYVNYTSPVDQRRPRTPNTGQCEPVYNYYTNLYILSYYHELTTNNCIYYMYINYT